MQLSADEISQIIKSQIQNFDSATNNGIVERIDERIERFATTAHDDVVRHVSGREAHWSTNQIIEGDV